MNNANLPNTNSQMSHPKVSIEETTAIKCEECGNESFAPSFVLRKVSRLLTGQSQDGITPIQVFSCTKCAHVNKDFLPKEIQGLE